MCRDSAPDSSHYHTRNCLVFVPFDQHAANITRVAREPMVYAGWPSLSLAVSIRSIVVDAFNHEPFPYLCKFARKYGSAQVGFREGFITEFTVFAFVWEVMVVAIKQASVPELSGLLERKPKGTGASVVSSMTGYF